MTAKTIYTSYFEKTKMKILNEKQINEEMEEEHLKAINNSKIIIYFKHY